MKLDDEHFIFFGKNHHKVLQNLWHSKFQKESFAESHNDRKLGLIIEGGGMRGVISTAMLVALHELQFNSIFDAVYGTSAGALGGAYFLSGQAPYGISVFYEEFNTRHGINYHRVPPYVNVDYLMEIVREKKVLNVDLVKKAPSELFINATDTLTGKPRYFSNRERINLLDAIHASCALPILYDKPVAINGGLYLDGGIVGSLPVEQAIKDGCSDILILLTNRTERKYRSVLPLWYEQIRLKKYSEGFRRAYFSRDVFFKRALNLMRGDDERARFVNIAAIAPRNHGLNLYTCDAHKLKKAYRDSYQYMRQLLLHFKPSEQNSESEDTPLTHALTI